ncbi:MAG TPA: hypothetical protein VF811_09270 [Parasulfuritortus sp.]
MSAALNEIIVHLDENVDDSTLAELEQTIRKDPGIVSVGHRPERTHLLMVVYDSAVVRAADILHVFRDRQLHAQLVGM